ncbi:MAG: hypothetical protein HYY93_14995 [Planctomycetes bacterium]|nr:hypothetical protein [Planctomycetota bacterium]
MLEFKRKIDGSTWNLWKLREFCIQQCCVLFHLLYTMEGISGVYYELKNHQLWKYASLSGDLEKILPQLEGVERVSTERFLGLHRWLHYFVYHQHPELAKGYENGRRDPEFRRLVRCMDSFGTDMLRRVEAILGAERSIDSGDPTCPKDHNSEEYATWKRWAPYRLSPRQILMRHARKTYVQDDAGFWHPRGFIEGETEEEWPE